MFANFHKLGKAVKMTYFFDNLKENFETMYISYIRLTFTTIQGGFRLFFKFSIILTFQIQIQKGNNFIVITWVHRGNP